MTLAIDRLLLPVPGELPCGVYLRYDPIYHQIEEAREEEDPSLPQGVWQHSLKKAEWNKVIELCTNALEQRSKDLQLAFWLMEAATHVEGFSGFSQGLELVLGLCRNYWRELHPQASDGEFEHRGAIFFWANEKLALPLKQLAITAPLQRDIASFTFLQWEMVLLAMKGGGARDSGAEDKAALTPARFAKSLDATPSVFFSRAREDLRAAAAHLRDLDALLEEQLGKAKPSLRGLSELVAAIIQKMTVTLEERGERGTESGGPVESAELQSGQLEEPNMESNETREGSLVVTGGRGSGPISNRREAYRQLGEIAEFLMRIEPHSPVPYLLKRVSSWEDMSLDQLLREVVPGLDDRSRLRESFFLKPE